jgi:hypothetical protein
VLLVAAILSSSMLEAVVPHREALAR